LTAEHARRRSRQRPGRSRGETYLSFEFVDGESSLGKGFARVLSLGSFSDGFLLLIVGGGSGLSLLGFGSSSLLLLLFLLGGSVDDSLLDEGGLADNFSNVGLVDDGVEVSEGVGSGGTDLGVEDLGETETEGDGNVEIGEGDALSDKESAGSEGLLEVVEEFESAGLVGLYLVLVVGLESSELSDPGSNGSNELSVGPRSPLLNESSLFLRGTEETGLVGLDSDVLSISRRRLASLSANERVTIFEKLTLAMAMHSVSLKSPDSKAGICRAITMSLVRRED